MPDSRQRTCSTRDERGRHNAAHLPGIDIDHYNLTLRDPQGDGFIGDRASQTAFRALLDAVRRRHLTGEDPFDTPSTELRKQDIDLVLVGGDADAAHAVHLAVEEYARRLCHVVQVFLAQPQWAGVERIVLGGGFTTGHETGGLAMRRAMRLLALSRTGVRLYPLGHDPDEAGLLGWTALLPDDARERDAFLAVDVGGTNIRCGIVEHRLRRSPTGAGARVIESMIWRHADDAPSRGQAVVRLAAMLNALSAFARTLGLRLSPFVGIACPGQVERDGSLSAGAQNLPGDWERPFNLPDALAARLDPVDGAVPRVVMHNDAVVQGLSELHRMRKARRWGVLTIGTGLGNASFTMR